MRHILESTPKTGMAVINDVGEANDIHPKDKQTPGERLARWALAKDYGRELVYSSPLYRSSQVKDGRIHLTFDHVGAGLKARDGGELKRFEIAGADQVWHWAKAAIQGEETVVVSSDNVSAPIAVRYAWASNPEGANLVNSEGLPASVFRTDDWEDVDKTPAPAATANRAALEARRKLGAEIKALNAKLKTLDRGSPEFTATRTKIQELLVQFRESAGKR